MRTRDEDAKAVGVRLEAYIRASGMNYVDFAKAIATIEGPDSKVSPQTVTHWRRTGKIAREKLKVICRVLKISPNDLLGIDQSHSPAPFSSSPPKGVHVPLEADSSTPSIIGTLDRLRTQIDRAPESVRRQVMELVMTYIESPEEGARIGRAIEVLLGYGESGNSST